MTELEIAAHLLQAVPNDFYCDACLASAVQVSAAATDAIAAMLAERSDFERREASCVGCGRTTVTIAYVPVKCARCSQTIDDVDLVIERGERFHRQCWQILQSLSRIADSRQMARLSQELIRGSRDRLKSRERP